MSIFKYDNFINEELSNDKKITISGLLDYMDSNFKIKYINFDGSTDDFNDFVNDCVKNNYNINFVKSYKLPDNLSIYTMEMDYEELSEEVGSYDDNFNINLIFKNNILKAIVYLEYIGGNGSESISYIQLASKNILMIDAYCDSWDDYHDYIFFDYNNSEIIDKKYIGY